MALLMKAKEAANRINTEIMAEVSALGMEGITPHLAAIIVDGDPASAYYAEAKRRIAERLGVSFCLHAFQADAEEAEIMALVRQLNEDASVHGIMLELPLPQHISARKVEREIRPSKDIDGVTPQNKLATMTGEPGLYPATPQACIYLLKHYGFALEGKNVTLVGRGQTVGLPLFHLLQREQSTVTVCHSRTPDIASHLSHADIAFLAVGRPNRITSAMVHDRLIVVDAGINETEDGRITGDGAADLDAYVTAVSPVPGGVGTLTTAILFQNLMKAIRIQQGREEQL
ncbi:bifunctional 5,10-methylene-tetrahydrofolate dehydrogenase/5,10-methylene-tetrahydrofolate cyclohydrolase [Paenibacillus sp. 1011MAR3C5]|uniref:bifunctional 5,10-methylenetetrahydrofolate dehydrogenase/5,10-methenyltetrahydrofolate cyclohydrolase n=1 Tax=Paenibacillus sp. 1011MAR3C5 TaxID=1675787 RepID=UPI000E6C5CB0|nr:tetrahydrofolate dehydrogenase/cyclohydrolase catalytic domain-containing protein [Paenibacillus sp. 1011MAR3C5]RJE87487.1 bifunctional 5,10-methylene-tetrahydrofolate dehydrogenase/5,10-methylene-tetrahydrofolate cyclohydrolase [Paenibacillus sp. 1011MAR3C5]